MLLAFFAQACDDPDMKITDTNTIKLENVPSGSGIAKSGDAYYVIGDDSPFLFTLNEEFEVISKTRLLDSDELLGKRIIKCEKPDFETLEMINENELVVFGSGSKSPQRDVFVRILLKDSVIVESYVITDFYDRLRNLPLLQDSELNIEATAFRDNHIFLFNRKKNLIIKFEYSDLLSYIKGEAAFPKPEIKEYFLPTINGIEAGFSGATALKAELKIIFTAAVEDTDNAYDDGEILGSFIGMIDISDNNLADIIDYCAVPSTEQNFKVESVTIEEEISSGKTRVVLITDDDMGNSIIIESILAW